MEKHIITEEMIQSFQQMLLSQDGSDTKLAMDILDNRDKKNEDSEGNFKQLMNIIFNEDAFFPTAPMYGIEINGRLLKTHKGSAFNTEAEAKAQLSRHLTSYLGTEHSIVEVHVPKSNTKYQYFKAMKQIFKSGIGLRNFLIKNNIAKIVRLDMINVNNLTITKQVTQIPDWDD
jgi:hypothetical protein